MVGVLRSDRMTEFKNHLLFLGDPQINPRDRRGKESD
jgi:hypothetical protein